MWIILLLAIIAVLAVLVSDWRAKGEAAPAVTAVSRILIAIPLFYVALNWSRANFEHGLFRALTIDSGVAGFALLVIGCCVATLLIQSWKDMKIFLG